MKMISDDIPGYTFGAAEIPVSPVSLQDLDRLIATVGLTDDDWRYLRMAGEVLTGQTQEIVKHWRNGIIAGIPHLARHTRTPEGVVIPEYQARSNLRFEQWILDTCLRITRCGRSTRCWILTMCGRFSLTITATPDGPPLIPS